MPSGHLTRYEGLSTHTAELAKGNSKGKLLDKQGDKRNQWSVITRRNPSTGNLTQHKIISCNKKNSCVQVYPKYCGHCKLKSNSTTLSLQFSGTLNRQMDKKGTKRIDGVLITRPRLKSTKIRNNIK